MMCMLAVDRHPLCWHAARRAAFPFSSSFCLYFFLSVFDPIIYHLSEFMHYLSHYVQLSSALTALSQTTSGLIS